MALKNAQNIVGRAVIVAALIPSLNGLAVTIRVDSHAQPGGQGESWSTAFPGLEAALEFARDGENNVDEIWVAAIASSPPPNGPYGVYLPSAPSGGDPRAQTFKIDAALNGIKIYGGFLGLANGGGETNIDQRQPFELSHRTYLAGWPTEAVTNRKYHVLTIENVGPSTRIDGFWIVHGGGPIEPESHQGQGAGMLIRNANPTIVRCAFWHNKAYTRGSGIDIDDPPAGVLNIINCAFIDNATDSAENVLGAGIYNGGGTIDMMNCQFNGNKGALHGAGIYNDGGHVTVVNTTMHCGAAPHGHGGGIYTTGAGSTLTVTNSVFWHGFDSTGLSTVSAQIYADSGTPVVTFCCIDDGDPFDPNDPNDDPNTHVPFGGAANHNIDEDPLFVDSRPEGSYCDAPDADLRLEPSSPCIGRGNCAAVPADIADLNYLDGTSEPTPLDLGMNAAETARFHDRIDMGAFEQATVETECIYDTNSDGVVNIDDLVVVITSWGSCPANPAGCPGDISPFDSSNLCGSHSVDINDLVAIITNWQCGYPDPAPPPQSVLDCLTEFSSEFDKLQACIEAMIRGGTP